MMKISSIQDMTVLSVKYLRHCLGVGTLQHIFKKQIRFGNKRKHHTKGSGNIIRYSLH